MSDAQKLAMGGGGGKRRRRRRTPGRGVKLIARAVSGIELKDLRSLAVEGKRQSRFPASSPLAVSAP